MKKICSTVGCDKNVVARGLCVNCYNKRAKLIKLGLAPSWPSKNKLCSIDGCEKLVWAKGFCQHHYNKNRNSQKHKTPPKERRGTILYVCKGCGKRKAYYQWQMCQECYKKLPKQKQVAHRPKGKGGKHDREDEEFEMFKIFTSDHMSIYEDIPADEKWMKNRYDAQLRIEIAHFIKTGEIYVNKTGDWLDTTLWIRRNK